MFEECPVVRYVRNGDVMAVYLRKSPACQINAYQYFTTRWSKVNNELHTDFELYDNLADLGRMKESGNSVTTWKVPQPLRPMLG